MTAFIAHLEVALLSAQSVGRGLVTENKHPSLALSYIH